MTNEQRSAIADKITSLYDFDTSVEASTTGAIDVAGRLFELYTNLSLEITTVEEEVLFSNGRGVVSRYPLRQVEYVRVNDVDLPVKYTFEYGLVVLNYPYCGEAFVKYQAGLGNDLPEEIVYALAHLAVFLLRIEAGVIGGGNEVKVDFSQLPPIVREVIERWRG